MSCADNLTFGIRLAAYLLCKMSMSDSMELIILEYDFSG
jgi:hypothetical protein